MTDAERIFYRVPGEFSYPPRAAPFFRPLTCRQCPLHRGLLGVASGQPGFRMHTGHAEEAGVRRDRLGRLDGGGPAGDRGVLEEPAAEREHIGGRMFDERRGQRGAV
jgi:hypothetical protein